MEENLKIWNDAKRIVVKVGSSLVTNEGHGVDTEADCPLDGSVS